MSDYKTQSKKNSLMKLKAKMAEMGGYSDEGAMKATVIAKDEEGLTEGLEKASELMKEKHESMEHDEYSEYSKEELIEMLKNK